MIKAIRGALFHIAVAIVCGCDPVASWTSASYRAAAMPRVYMTYAASNDFDGDIRNLRAHGVDAIEWAQGGTNKTDELAVLRRYGMKALVWCGEISHNPPGIERLTGRKAVRARCIGGIYRGLDVGRHLFEFSAAPQKIVIEPPRRNKGSYWTGCVPVAAEVVVPLREFDGEQHLKIVPATVCAAAPGAVLENDTAATDEKQKAARSLYEVSFDLSGLSSALLDKIGLAVYWEDDRNASVFDKSTAEAWEHDLENRHKFWKEVGGGTFPSDVIKAARVGDETFNWTADRKSVV